MRLGTRLTSDGQPRSPSLEQASSEQQQERAKGNRTRVWMNARLSLLPHECHATGSSVVALSVHPTTRGQLLGSLHIAGSFGQWCPTFGGTPPSFSGKVRYAPLLQVVVPLPGCRKERDRFHSCSRSLCSSGWFCV
ncbi:hypothetical protein AVEN_269916-1 [Araneus ventricosus]|uniref:Uncharacterized protein n=1 Tax=Araneus ventricosus TaxID=182803 RepID=A0A4Y2FRG9_ARAVE|nr:hypothetical protein AVEN_269916-1 [Araneus ventricosus]